MFKIFADTFRIATRTDYDRKRFVDREQRQRQIHESDREFLRRWWDEAHLRR